MGSWGAWDRQSSEIIFKIHKSEGYTTCNPQPLSFNGICGYEGFHSHDQELSIDFDIKRAIILAWPVFKIIP